MTIRQLRKKRQFLQSISTRTINKCEWHMVYGDSLGVNPPAKLRTGLPIFAARYRIPFD